MTAQVNGRSAVQTNDAVRLDGVSSKDLFDFATADPITQDPPVAHPSPITAGQIPMLLVTAWQVARSAFEEVLQQSRLRVGGLRGMVAPEAASNARAAADRAMRNSIHWQDLKDRIVAVVPDRHTLTRLAVRKAVILLLLLGAADTGLNSAAAIYSGDPIWLAIISFAGIAAATLAVGWACGDKLRRVGDALRAGPPTPEAAELNVTLLFAKPGDRLRLFSWLVLLAVSTTLIAIGVAVLRYDAGASSVYGLFSASVNLGAAFLAYVAVDPAKAVLDDLDKRITAERATAQAEEGTVDRALKFEEEADAEDAAAPGRARARYHAVFSDALARITRDAATYGVLIDPAVIDAMAPEPAQPQPQRAPQPSRVVSRHPLPGGEDDTDVAIQPPLPFPRRGAA